MSLIAEPPRVPTESPDWSTWVRSVRFAVGIEEEIMVLAPGGFTLAPFTDEFLATMRHELASSVAGETHQAVLELTSAPHRRGDQSPAELAALRAGPAGHVAAGGAGGGAG